MKRIGILTAGGDTPALNATIHSAVVRANQLKVELYGLIKGFNCLFNPRVTHVHLNPLYQEVPELDPTKGGTLIGSSRDFVDPNKKDDLDLIASRLKKLGIDGRICFRNRRGLIHSRSTYSARYDPSLMKPSWWGIDYLRPIFTDASGEDDAEHMRRTLFAAGNLAQPYHSINTDVHKRIRHVEPETSSIRLAA